jgi:hypothetical protein
MGLEGRDNRSCPVLATRPGWEVDLVCNRNPSLAINPQSNRPMRGRQGVMEGQPRRDQSFGSRPKPSTEPKAMPTRSEGSSVESSAALPTYHRVSHGPMSKKSATGVFCFTE